jgi:tetratricopeptide (TPR) repeat protein
VTLLQDVPMTHHRNLASVQYQIALIWSRQGQPERALPLWKHVLTQQRLVWKDEQHHLDLARTLEAIAYQQLERWKKARAFLEGALDIYKEAAANTSSTRTRPAPQDLARAGIYSRLATVLLELGERQRAERALGKSMKLYQSLALPPPGGVLLAHRAQSAGCRRNEEGGGPISRTGLTTQD